MAPTCGVYLVVIGTSVPGTTGNYQLFGNNLLGGPNLCSPVIAGTQVSLTGVGGIGGAPFIVSTTTNIQDRPTLWVPFATNRFDSAGFLKITNTFDLDPPRYFRITTPLRTAFIKTDCQAFSRQRHASVPLVW